MSGPDGTPARRPRLLLVEDDASIRRFVSMALDGQPLDVVEAPLLAAAIEALRVAPFDVVLCDLMLPDGSGLDLLRALAGPDSRSPRARRIAFSAGLSSAIRVQLLQAGVHEMLSKPVSLADLEACVARALDSSRAEAAEPRRASGAAHAAQHFFGGDEAMYQGFLAVCRPQFAHDAATGEQAVQQADLPALRRLTHSLKSVLLTLGLDDDSLLAGRIEDASHRQDSETAWALWPQLHGRLQALTQPPPGAGD
jgi:DNA-binding response OmpR family regulator